MLTLHISEGFTISIGRSHSRAIPALSSTILLDLSQATRSNCRKSCHLWRRKQSRRKYTISCMPFGQFRYLGVHTTCPWWSVLWRKVLFRSEQCSASTATGSVLLWDSESRTRFLSITPSFRFQFPFNNVQYLSSRSSPNSMIWWLRFMTWIKMTMSIVEMRRNKWKKSLESHCTSMLFRLVQMSASKVSAG